MKDVFVRIKKLETREDAQHPDLYLPADYEKVVEMRADMFEKPKVDSTFKVFGHMTWFQSSVVVEILEDELTSGKFKTLNSVYGWELLTKEPENEIDGKNITLP
jgi:hypothetical protein